MRVAAALTLLALSAHVHADLDRELAAIVADPAAPLASLSVLAIRGGKVVYHRQFGALNEGKTLYRVASISKLVTTLGVMRLVEARVLDLDRDVGEYLGWPLRNPHFPEAKITLRMLLAHTSSLRDDADYFWPEGHKIRDKIAGKAWSAEAAPGARFSYANLPWGVVGTVMEKATGERFDRLMHRLVIGPLGLSGGFSPADMSPGQLRRIATLYRQGVAQVDDYSKEPPVPRAGPSYVPGENGTLFAPQGGLRASAEDLGRVMRMLIGRGEIEGQRFLEAGTVDLMLSRQWTRADNPRDRFQAWGLGNQHFLDVSGPGYGDRLVEGGGFTGAGHHGDAYGLTGIFAFDPRTKNGLIFLTGGPGFDPETRKGQWSSFYRHEERILTTLHRHAIRGD